ncbi:MAG: DUF5819 family protein [Crocinitomicaceae bacterium]
MKRKNKILVGWLAFLFVIFHMSCLFIHAAPSQIIPDRYKEKVSAYIDPLFRQNWSLFAPCPVIDGRVKMKINFQKDSIDWHYPFAGDVYWHSIFRGSHHSELALLESHLVFWLGRDLEGMQFAFSEELTGEKLAEFNKGKSYVLYRRYAVGISKKMDKEVVSVELACELKNVKTDEEGTFYLPAMKM